MTRKPCSRTQNVLSLIDTAAIAIEAFDRTATEEQADILALMLVRARG